LRFDLLPLLDEARQDARYALKTFARNPGFAAVVIATLSLGIGANSAIFTAVDTILLRPLPYPSADRLVVVSEVNPNQRTATSWVAPVKVEEWNRENRTFEALAGGYFDNMTDTTGSLPERDVAIRTSPRFFRVLGTPAALGRTFTAEEETFGGPSAVVLSDSFWRTRFNADPSVLNRTLTLADQKRTVVGIMPPSFLYPTTTTDIWVPAQLPPALVRTREARFYSVVGRLREGVTTEQAKDDLLGMQRRLGDQFPRTDRGWDAAVSPLKEQQVAGVRRSLWIVFGAVLLVLLAACGNVACLMLAAALRRQHEIAVRFSLGADRRRLLRQLIVEGLLLSLGGSIGGLLLGSWGITLLRETSIRMPRAAELHVDGRLVAFTLAIGVLTTMLFALAPALQATKFQLSARLAHGRTLLGSRQTLQRLLVAVQVALAIVLLVGAGLLLRTFARLQQVRTGFDASNVVTFRVSGSFSERPAAITNRQSRTLQRLRSMPDVESAALGIVLPADADADYPATEFTIDGRTTGDHYFAVARSVSADYFRTLRIPVLRGETCRDDPRPDARPAVLINQSFADQYFPGDAPIGHHIVGPQSRGDIIGIVGDAREQNLAKDPRPIVYWCGLVPYYPAAAYLVRVRPGRVVTIATIREAVHEIEPGRAVYAAASLSDVLARSLSQPRLNAVLLGLFAAMALMLATVGLFGMLAQFVVQKRREIGLRMALGAQPTQVLAEVFRYSASTTGVGIAAGIALALGMARFIAALVFGIESRDPLTFAIVPLMLAAVAGLATIIPARRAVRIDPVTALRDE
jgi:putative ABC transport system permease protein